MPLHRCTLPFLGANRRRAGVLLIVHEASLEGQHPWVAARLFQHGFLFDNPHVWQYTPHKFGSTYRAGAQMKHAHMFRPVPRSPKGDPDG